MKALSRTIFPVYYHICHLSVPHHQIINQSVNRQGGRSGAVGGGGSRGGWRGDLEEVGGERGGVEQSTFLGDMVERSII